MFIACWVTKATHTFRVCYTYSFPTATLVARARPDFGNTLIACSSLLIGRGKSINNRCFLSTRFCYGRPLQLLALAPKTCLCHWTYLNHLNLQSWVFQFITLYSSVFRVVILYCDFSHQPIPIHSGLRFITANCSSFI